MATVVISDSYVIMLKAKLLLAILTTLQLFHQMKNGLFPLSKVK